MQINSINFQVWLKFCGQKFNYLSYVLAERPKIKRPKFLKVMYLWQLLKQN